MSDSDLATRVSLDEGGARVSPCRPRHTAAQGLAGTVLAERFCFWRGRSGRRYVFSVYKHGPGGGFAAMPRYADAVVISAERCSDGTRRIVRLGQTGTLPELVIDGHGGLAADRTSHELHFHLLADGASERNAVLLDLGAATDTTS